MAKSLIENLATDWKPARYHDRYRSQLLDLLQKKAEGEPLPEPAETEGGEVVDLMEALRQSVAQTQRGRKSGGRARTKSGARKSARKAS
jgi:DNA end-binding protein Ku